MHFVGAFMLVQYLMGSADLFTEPDGNDLRVLEYKFPRNNFALLEYRVK